MMLNEPDYSYPIPTRKLRPRENLVLHGARYLTDSELMAVLIGSGIKNNDVTRLSGAVLRLLDEVGTEVTLSELSAIAGMGLARATRLLAAFEFTRRRIIPEGQKISSPEDVFRVVSHFSDRKQEHFLALSLNGAGELIQHRVVSVGLVNQTQVHPREVFVGAISDRASSIIVAHNHPSGSLPPSPQDVLVTGRLFEAGETLGISLLDHIIFSRRGFRSLRSHEDFSFHDGD